MPDEQLTSALNETKFPGNSSAYDELLSALKVERVVGLIGAGVSAPLFPTWSLLLNNILNDILSEGLITESDYSALHLQIENDPLEAASFMEEISGRDRFRAKLSTIFSVNDQCTPAHELLMTLPIDGFVTLNYDGGLSTSFVRQYKRMPSTIRMEDSYNVSRWSQDINFRYQEKPIVHLHGVASSPNNMIFTADDYNKFYSQNQNNVNFVTELWKLNRLLVVGFGFRDPFLIRIAENALRTLPSDDRHFALIGYHSEQKLSTIERRIFARKYRLKPIFYEIRLNAEGQATDHGNLLTLLANLVPGNNTAIQDIETVETIKSVATPTTTPIIESATLAAKRDLEKNLFVSWTQKQLYVQPRLYSHNDSSILTSDIDATPVTIEEVINSEHSYVVSAPHEYGATTLCKKLAYEFQLRGSEAFYRDAANLPNYKKKLEQDIAFSPIFSDNTRILILDNVSPHSHERLLKEIVGLRRYSKIIIIVKTSEMNYSAMDGFDFSSSFSYVRLGYLTREDIRSLATQLYDTFDTDLISGAVEKVYSDLLDLCIPLTPSNVIMYMSIVHREGDFVALNRLQIMDRYIKEILRRPSDLYHESFNTENKINIVSLFVVDLYNHDLVQFREEDWSAFCKSYMTESLNYFDYSQLFADLVRSRVLINLGDIFVFKYRLFYSYFLGRYFANRPVELHKFLDRNLHMKIEGLIEVISGFSADNTALVTDLSIKLESAVSRFYDEYKIHDLDPYAGLTWVQDDQEEKNVWTAVSDKLSSGPANGDEIDELKKSIYAEKRTEDQTVTIKKFSDIENSVAYNQQSLISAIRNSSDISGPLKVRAMSALYESYVISYQIPLIFAPIIAEKKYFVWNDVLYINLLVYNEDDKQDLKRRVWKIVNAIPDAVKNRATEQLGTKKLSEVFRYFATNGNLSGFKKFLNFSLILRSKPKGWEKLAEEIIISTEKTSLYLKYMLTTSLKQYTDEINTNSERNSLKRLVAIIRTKRDFNMSNPTSRSISKTIAAFDKANYLK